MRNSTVFGSRKRGDGAPWKIAVDEGMSIARETTAAVRSLFASGDRTEAAETLSWRFHTTWRVLHAALGTAIAVVAAMMASLAFEISFAFVALPVSCVACRRLVDSTDEDDERLRWEARKVVAWVTERLGNNEETKRRKMNVLTQSI